ncbi:GDP-mannose 4,6-dehydratase [Candidatus Pelagibacter bacterium nBUS_30]|uniref:GDP-mannose 4,6-dehydratase n=1 Tax=Candidatus Pelagibacter bacterium nBUS_30 TaxID=3374191 RepID=UPI003EBAC803
MNKVLILGSNSFAGSCYVDHLLNNKYQVYGVSRSNERKIAKYKFNKNIKNFKFIKADINKNISIFKKLILENKFKYIVDFLGQGMVAESWENPQDWLKTNITSKTELVNFLLNKKFLKKYVRISTPEVYGSSSAKMDEKKSYNPSTPYAITHMTIDKYLEIYNKQYKFPSVILRLANFYGETQPLYRIIPKTISSIINKKKLPLHGNGKSLRSFIYIDDFCSAIYLAMKKSKNGKIYNVSSKEIISIKNIIKLICFKMNYKYKKLVIIKNDRKGKDFKYFMNSNKITKELNWKNKTNLKKGLQKTIQWHLENLKVLKKEKNIYIHKK